MRFETHESLGSLEAKLNYAFNHPSLLKEALTHASYANESGLSYYNERLEFLGDSVLGLCVAAWLYRNRPGLSEGAMTRERARLVCEAALAALGAGMDLPKYLRLGKGLEHQNGRTNPSVIADAAEAVIGAVFLDGGFEAASRVVGDFLKFIDQTAAPLAGDEAKTPKTVLQELLQAAGSKPPTYKLVSRTGPDHSLQFKVEVWSEEGRKLAEGSGGSIKLAEENAARAALRSHERKGTPL